MAGRPPLPIGHNGVIRTAKDGKVWRSLTWYRDVDGKSRRVTATGTTKSGAEQALKAKLKIRSVAGGDVDLGPESTVAELAAVWVPTMDQGQSTQDKYQWYLDRRILPALGEYRLREATTARLEGFLRRMDASYGASAPKMCRIVLSLMFGLAARYDAVPTNPVRDTQTSKPQSGEKRNERVMTVAEVHRFREDIAAWVEVQPKQARARVRLVDAVEVYIATGLRPMELLALLRTDIDFKTRTLTVTGTVKRDSVNGLHRQPFPKSKRARSMVLPEYAVTVLRRRVMESPTDLVFPNRDGAVIEPANWRRTMREFREWSAARGRDWSWVEHRGFRAAVATLIDSESGSKVAAAQLGHGSDAITLKHYIKKTSLAPDSSALLERFQ